MRTSIIVAISENRVIGNRGQLPWRLSADLRRFKRLTTGHAIVMGRKTFESIGRPLPDRTSIVLTRRPEARFPGALTASSLDHARRLAAGDNELFVIGGAQLYAQALAEADRIYLTRVHAVVEGDAFFPEVDFNQWRAIEESQHRADERNQFDHSFYVYDRVTISGLPLMGTSG